MFIKPIETTAFPPSVWQDHAGNIHFALQSRKSRSLFSGLSLVGNPNLKRLADYEFRIILRLQTKKTEYLIAVDSTFESIHENWNWVEQNFFMKLTESNTNNEQNDAALLQQFNEMTEEIQGKMMYYLHSFELDSKTLENQSIETHVKLCIQRYFVNLKDEILLDCIYYSHA